MRPIVLLFLLLAVPAAAQESRFHSNLRREGEDVKQSCGAGFQPKGLFDCIVTLATDDPFHVAMGSLAPGNGTAFGLAFSEHYTPNVRWRIGWDADGVVASSGSWRAGAYMRLIHIPDRPVVVVRRPGTTQPQSSASVTLTEYPVLNIFAQTISLDELTVEDGQGAFSEKQTIVGSNLIYPLARVPALRPLHVSLVGGINGRFLDVRGDALSEPQQPAFAQFEEGIRFKPALFDNRFQLNYLVDFQQFATSEDSHASFHRWSLDLKHSFPLYRTVSSTGPKDTNGPNECFVSVGSVGCPPVSYSRNLEGSISFRLLTSRSGSGPDSSVPFYFQPTLGGSDINGERLLAGYDDYRFRAPNLFVLQESVEHSLWGPIGIFALVEQGKISAQNDDSGSFGFKNSFALGLTLRAGGFPLVNLSFAWGGDGHHIIGAIDSSLLGGSGRPSLY